MSDNQKVEEIDLTLYPDESEDGDVNNIRLADADVLDGTAPVDAKDEDVDDDDDDDDENATHHFIIRYNDNDVNIKVNTKTAYRLQNDLNYAEKFVSSLMQQKVIKNTHKVLKSSDILQNELQEASIEGSEEPAEERNSTVDEDKRQKPQVLPQTSDSELTWTYEAIGTLIEARLKMEDQFSKSFTDKPSLWMKVAEHMKESFSIDVSWDECLRKFKYMLKAYRRNHKLKLTSNKMPTWPFYNLFNEAYGSKMESQVTSKTPVLPRGENRKKSWTETDTWNLVNLRLSMNDEFTNIEGTDDTELWEKVCKEVNENNTGGLKSPRTCKLKWYFLLDMYRKKRDPSISEAARNCWSYYAVLHKAFNGSIPNEDEVDERAKSASWESSITECLLKTRIEMDTQFGSTLNKRSFLWDKVASIVNETKNVNLTGTECHDRYRNSFRTYKQNVKKAEIFGRRPMWRYFDIMHAAYQGTNLSMRPVSEASTKTTVKNLWFERNNKLLIKFRLELGSEFVNRTLWLQIAQKMNSATKSHLFTWMACHFQWRKLRLEYDGLVERKRLTGQCDPWPYFELFSQVYNDQPYDAAVESVCTSHNVNDDNRMEELMDVDDGLENNSANDEGVTNSNVLNSTRSPLPRASTSKRLQRKAPELGSPHTERNPSRRLKTSTRREDEYYEVEASKAIDEAIAGAQGKSSKTNAGHKFKGWFKTMLIDWKEERQQRWQEKKQLEREKIKAINNLTKAILALDPDVDLHLGSESVKRRKLDM